MAEQRKREIAYKLFIGEILKGNPIIEEQQADISAGGVRERFKLLEFQDKQVVRVNIIANVVDKFVAEGEKRWATITLDDASGQIKVKVFGDDTAKLQEVNQGDTLVVIGMLRSFNKELYILPEIIKKVDPRYLLIRKLEIEKIRPQNQSTQPTPGQEPQQDPAQPAGLREQIIQLIKEGEASEGIDTEQIILKLKDSQPDQINTEITKLLEDGIVYEPRPGRVRYLG